MCGQPGGDLAALEPVALELEARAVDLLLGLQRLEQPLAQHPELQAVEQRVHLVPVPGLQPQLGRVEVQRQVADQCVELAVADHVAEVFTQALASLAGDLVGVGDHALKAVVLDDPLGRGLGPDTGDTRQVVGVLPDERRELGIAMGRYAVLRLDRGRRHPGQV